MSEFRQEWQQSPDMDYHLGRIKAGLEVIDSHIIMPEDDRWKIGYGALVMGGSVFGEGKSSNGKSEWGNVVLGEHRRIDIDPQDTVGVLEGVESVVTHKTTKPKINVLDERDVLLFFDEVAHLRETAPLHKYWTGREVLLPNGQVLDMTNASIYSTANFPGDEGSAKPLNHAIRSRLGINILAGDSDESFAKRLARFEKPELQEKYDDGLLPPAKVRRDIRSGMEFAAPLSTSAADFMVDITTIANGSGLLKPIDPGNKRNHMNWVHAARARRLIDAEERMSGAITREEIARVASLGLGSFVKLTSTAEEQLANAIGAPDVLQPIETAIFARRAIAGLAMYALFRAQDIRIGKDADEEIANFMRQRSYANLLGSHLGVSGNSPIDEVLVQGILNPAEGTQNHATKPKTSIFRFGRR